jgi:RNA polymerase sigma factor (sigma-70 family)
VDLDQSSREGGVDRFRTTRWDIVLLSAQSQAPGYKEALAELCNLYWYPLYAFVRRRGHSPEDAQDLTQGFFLDLLEHKAFTRVDQQNGKFRSFLLASLRHYLANETRSALSLKRGAHIEFVYLNTQNVQNAENRYGREEPIEALTPEKIFDARWAMALLGEARKRLSLEYSAEGRAATFEALIDFLDPLNSKKLPSYDQVADQLNVSVAAVKTLIHRLRKQYTELVREEISRTVSNASDLDAETHELCEALIASEGRILA